eukprot:2247128-Pleurochrysis_carterae.AAC.1
MHMRRAGCRVDSTRIEEGSEFRRKELARAVTVVSADYAGRAVLAVTVQQRSELMNARSACGASLLRRRRWTDLKREGAGDVCVHQATGIGALVELGCVGEPSRVGFGARFTSLKGPVAE